MNMDYLTLRTWCGGHEELADRIWKLEDMSGAWLSMKSDICKAAYLIFYSAKGLHDVDIALGNKSNQGEPNDLPYHLVQSNYPQATTIVGVTLAGLGSFEDLFYAAIAKHKELEHTLTIKIDNGFIEVDKTYFSYPNAPLSTLGQITGQMLRTFLATMKEVLSDKSLIAVLIEGIERKNGRPLNADGAAPGMQSLLDVHNMSSAMIFAHLAEKHHSNSETKQQDPVAAKATNNSERFKKFGDAAKKRQAARQVKAEQATKARTIQTLSRAPRRYRSCEAMIKSHNVPAAKALVADAPLRSPLSNEVAMTDVVETSARGITVDEQDVNMTEVPQAHGLERPTITNYHESNGAKEITVIATDAHMSAKPPSQSNGHSKCNKDLATPRLAKKPCICDKDCLCYQLCHTDLSKNCLCEENPLFVQITEGANIDELYVKDRPRNRRSRNRGRKPSRSSKNNGSAEVSAPQNVDQNTTSVHTSPVSHHQYQEVNGPQVDVNYPAQSIPHQYQPSFVAYHPDLAAGSFPSGYSGIDAYFQFPEQTAPAPIQLGQYSGAEHSQVPTYHPGPEQYPGPQYIEGQDYLRLNDNIYWRPFHMTRAQFAHWLVSSPYPEADSPPKYPSKRASIVGFFLGHRLTMENKHKFFC